MVRQYSDKEWWITMVSWLEGSLMTTVCWVRRVECARRSIAKPLAMEKDEELGNKMPTMHAP